jgi:predicted ester cyclase
MTVQTDLEGIYRHYLDCLNRQDWTALGQFVAEGVHHNGRPFGLAGYRQMLEADFRAVPDLSFHMDLVSVTASLVAARLLFDCTPEATFLDLPVNGRRVRFAEHVFYRFQGGLIAEVWSVIDKASIERQLADSGQI